MVYEYHDNQELNLFLLNTHHAEVMLVLIDLADPRRNGAHRSCRRLNSWISHTQRSVIGTDGVIPLRSAPSPAEPPPDALRVALPLQPGSGVVCHGVQGVAPESDRFGPRMNYT
jgi:hypothetical protein